MIEPAQPPDTPSDADEAAAVWMLRRSQAPVGVEEAFSRWLEADVDHRRAWTQAERGWGAFDEAEGDDLLNAMRARALSARPRPFRYWIPAAIAAAIAVAFVAAPLLFSGPRLPAPATNRARAAAPAAVEYATAVGQLRFLQLGDGSSVTLDTDSAITVAFDDRSRAVTLLHGRAFFKVAHDGARPFAVAARDRVVTAVGTQFDVRLDRSQLVVSMFQGRVAVSGGIAGRALDLSAGRRLVASEGRPDRVGPLQLDAARAWRGGRADFEDETLATVVAELNRYTPHKLVVRDPKVAALRVTASFRTGDPQRFSRALADIYPIRVVPLPSGELEIVEAR